eukprot:2235658-Pyramimonas_sp.AAC.1
MWLGARLGLPLGLSLGARRLWLLRRPCAWGPCLPARARLGPLLGVPRALGGLRWRIGVTRLGDATLPPRARSSGVGGAGPTGPPGWGRPSAPPALTPRTCPRAG